MLSAAERALRSFPGACRASQRLGKRKLAVLGGPGPSQLAKVALTLCFVVECSASPLLDAVQAPEATWVYA